MHAWIEDVKYQWMDYQSKFPVHTQDLSSSLEENVQLDESSIEHERSTTSIETIAYRSRDHGQQVSIPREMICQRRYVVSNLKLEYRIGLFFYYDSI